MPSIEVDYVNRTTMKSGLLLASFAGLSGLWVGRLPRWPMLDPVLLKSNVLHTGPVRNRIFMSMAQLCKWRMFRRGLDNVSLLHCEHRLAAYDCS